MKTFDELAAKMGKKLGRRRWTMDKSDRPKVFPQDDNASLWAGHPDGEIAGYIQRFCQDNHLKP